MTTMTHKGYIAEITYEDGDDAFHGVVLNTRATLHFAGRTPDELKAAFADTIADYEAWCRERGKTPEKPYSGKLLARISPERHARLAAAAARHGKSINAYLVEVLDRALGENGGSAAA